MAKRKKSDKGRGGRARPEDKSPSVMDFLSRISGAPKSLASSGGTVRSLLGGVTAEDLVAVGRLGAGLDVDNPPPPQAKPATTPTVPLPVELSLAGDVAQRAEALEVDFDDRYEDLLDEPAAGATRGRALAAAARDDARRPPRHAWGKPVEIRGVFHPPGAPPVASNLSLGGVFVETANLLDVGDPVVISFPSHDGGPRLTVSGRVRWVTPFGGLDDARPGMGIEFTGMDAAKRARVGEMLAASPVVGGLA